MTVIEKSMKERWEVNVISDKLIIELFWRRKNGTLPRGTWWEKLLERLKA